jgi:hypothetical protein
MAHKTGRAAREERERMLLLKHRFDTRITNVRFGKESLDSTDYSNSIKKFTEYLLVIAEVKKVAGIYDIRTAHFDPKKDITEMLMISHIYFEMARMFDAVPKFHAESEKCLAQFVHFSANQPYQVVNSEMIRKYLKKSSFKNPGVFRSAYEQIFVQSKQCYIVTFCYGDQHLVTQEFREFKDWLLESSWGQNLVRVYYKFSSEIVPTWENKTLPTVFGKAFVKPLLLLFSKTVLPFILKR